MKGIYFTEDGKKAIEDRIVELEKDLKEESNPLICIDVSAELNTYKRILCYATILPVEESWKHIGHDSGVFWGTDADILLSMYPNGVIIQPKQ
jgi:hypothetical protein